MKVPKLMEREVRTCSPEDRMAVPAGIMWRRDCGIVPVVEDNHLVGVITDRDICMAALFQGRTLNEIPVFVAMSRDVRSCAPIDELSTAIEIMRANRVRRVPVVVDDRRLVGILSLADLARNAASSSQDKKNGDSVTLEDVGSILNAICRPTLPVDERESELRRSQDIQAPSPEA